jgi:hypothetical protein
MSWGGAGIDRSFLADVERENGTSPFCIWKCLQRASELVFRNFCPESSCCCSLTDSLLAVECLERRGVTFT